MGFGRGMWVPEWAFLLAVCCIHQIGAQIENQTAAGSKYDEGVPQKRKPFATVSSKVNIIQPMLTNPIITSSNPAHNDRVCSTWGNFHFKTFDGDIYSFPGLCNYVFASHCNAPYEDFDIQIRRTVVNNAPTINRITMKLEGVAIELTKDFVTVDSNRIQLPYSQSGIKIEEGNIYVKVASKMGITLMWNKDDSILLELNEKYANQTCGLCGDFNGLPVYNEFYLNNVKMTALQFGNRQKMDGPMEHCEDSSPTLRENCTDNLDDICQKTLTSSAFANCNDLVDVREYITVCQDDLCHSEVSKNASCICDTIAEYSRQCAHAGGHPLNWRTSKLCSKKCPYNMQYQECSSPCTDTCTNPERSQICEEHCMDGCFCPQGTVFDDINNSGCIPQEQCSCVYKGNTYTTGASFSEQCQSCTCNGGRWNCQYMSCPGTCSVEGGSHISTYDKKSYNHHGDCTYILSKHCTDEIFTILVELRKCGLTDTETCLKTVILNMYNGQTSIEVKSDGGVFMNKIYTQLPISAANVTMFRPSTFFIIIQTNFGVHMEIQITPIMQLFVRLDPVFKNQTCGLCGNFNNIQTDDFKVRSGITEGTAPAFANMWKTQDSCPNIQISFENPCALSIANEKYAQHWCGLLTDSEGPFADCHYAVNPSVHHKNCMFDTCNCENSEDCLCAALSSYVRACAAEGIQLHGWRSHVCSKYTTSCPRSLSYSYTISSCQPTCRSLSEPDVTCSIKFVPVDGCTCLNGTYMDESGKCVPANECPCYYRGSPIPQGEVVRENGLVCNCIQGQLNCIGAPNINPVCESPMVHFDCRNATIGTTGAECQKSCQTLDMQCYSKQCVSGCVCPAGLVLDGNGGCIPEEECPCIHNEATYQSGEKINVDCNTCVCKNRKWECTENECLGTCAVYGDGHYNTFDAKRFSFNGNCEYTLVQDHCGKSGTTNGTFRVVTENIPCGNTGTTCSKSIKVFLEGYELILSEQHISVIRRGQNDEVPYTVRYMGMYLVIETTGGLILMWDKKTSIFIKLSPDFKGQICGLCGNYDGNGINDLTTRSQSVVENVLEFGNSWKVSSTCPDAFSIKDPCTTNPYRKSWSEKQCSIINSNVFGPCHSQVEPAEYYQACVTDACACDSGGDCDCFCTAVAAYAQACSEAGVCVAWRTPSICPLFCDYYNQHGECEWHYKPCGAPCMKTCRNPSGKCLHDLPGLEGCYPNCPPDKPYFHEDEMKCVSLCDCYNTENGKIYIRDECKLCECTSEGLQCKSDDKACYCTYEGNSYKYGELIYHTTDGTGWCFNATCDVNGTINRNIFKCGISTTTPFTFSTGQPTTTASAMTSTPPVTTVCVKEVCTWSEWYDSTQPDATEEGGDDETFANLRAKGHSVCRNPSAVQCRAKEYPDVDLQDLNQRVDCSLTTGLMCNNKDQQLKSCYNYEIRISCCSYRPCSEIETTTSRTTEVITTPTTLTSIFTVQTKIKPTQNRETKPQKTEIPTESPREESTITPAQTSFTVKTTQAPTTGYEITSAPRAKTSTVVTEAPTSPTIASTVHQPKPETTTATTTVSTTTALPTPSTTIITKTSRSTATKTSPSLTEGTSTAAPAETSMVTTQAATSPTATSTVLQPRRETTTGTVIVPTSTVSTRPGTTIITTTSMATTTSTSPPPKEGTTSIVTPTPTVPTSAATTTASTSITTNRCQPSCVWTQWFNLDSPTSGTQTGDVETFDKIRAAGYKLCDKPEDIQCRAKDYPNRSLEKLQQKFECSLDVGLVCRNEDQITKYPKCFDYEVRVKCCDRHHCGTTAAPPGTTAASTTTSLAETTTVATQASTSPIMTSTVPQSKPETSTATTVVLITTAQPTPGTTIMTTSSAINTKTSPQLTEGTSTAAPAETPTVGPRPPTTVSTVHQPRKETTTAPPTPGTAIITTTGRATTTRTSPPLTEGTTTPTMPNSASSTASTSGTTIGSSTASTTTAAPGETSTVATQAPSPSTTASTTHRLKIETTTVPPTPGTMIITTTRRASTTSISPPLTEGTTIIITPKPTLSTSTSSTVSTSRTTIRNPTASTTTAAPVETPTAATQAPTSPTTTSIVHQPKRETTPATTVISTTTVPATPGTTIITTMSTASTTETSPPLTEGTTTAPRAETSTVVTEAPTSPTIASTVHQPKPETTTATTTVSTTTALPTPSTTIITKTSRSTATKTSPSLTEGTSTAAPAETSMVTTQAATSPTATSTVLQPRRETTTGTVIVPTSTVSTRPGTTIITTTSMATTTSTSPPPKEGTTSIVTPTPTVPTSAATTTASTSITTNRCQPSCVWTQWFNLDSPTSGTQTGDVETFDKIRAAGYKLCDKPEDIQCRAKDYPNRSLEKLQQKFECSLDVGLVCRNEDQITKYPKCFDYEVRVKCCDRHHCGTTAAPPGTTAASTTTSLAETTVVATKIPAQPTPASTLPQILVTDTSGITVISTTTAQPTPRTTSITATSRATTTKTSPALTEGTTTIVTPTPTVPTSASSTASTSRTTTGSTPTYTTTAAPAETPTAATQAPTSPTTTSTVQQTKIETTTVPSTPGTNVITTTRRTSTTEISPPLPEGTTTAPPSETSTVATQASRSPTIASTVPQLKLKTTTAPPTQGTTISMTISRSTTSKTSPPLREGTTMAPPAETSTVITEASASPTIASTVHQPKPETTAATTVVPTTTRSPVAITGTSPPSTSTIATSSATAETSTHVTSRQTSPCLCHVFDRFFSPGEVVYNQTDKAGCHFYALCSEQCEIEPFHGLCPPTTPSTPVVPETTTQAASTTESAPSSASPTTATSLTTSVERNCTDVSPPRKAGESWISECQQCVCDPLTATAQCQPLSCEKNQTQVCEPGFISVPVLSPKDPCCPQYECRQMPDTCLINGTVYMVGMSTVIDSCKKCTCTSTKDPVTGENLMHCETIQCETSCPLGYEYMIEDGECCGKCIEVACKIRLSNTTVHVLNLDEILPLDNCSHYKCEKIEDQFVAVQSKKVCPVYEPGECDPNETETTPDGCCIKCKPPNCKPYSKKTVIRHGDCESPEPVELAYCEGTCPGSSVYSLKANQMQHECSCCQEFSTQTREVTLTCQNGTSINYNYIYVEQCQCMNGCTSETSAPHGSLTKQSGKHISQKTGTNQR